MSIVSVKQKPGRSRSTNEQSITEPITWIVTTSDASEPTTNIEAAPGVAYGQGHPTNSLLFAKDFEVASTDSPTVYEVTISYTGFRTGGVWSDTGGEQVPPTDMAPKVSWATQKNVESIDVDVNGKKIHNAVEEDFDPPLTANRSDLMCTIVRYVPQPNPTLYAAYIDTLNADTWRGFPRAVVRIDSITADPERIQQFLVYRETWTFIIHYGLPNQTGGWYGHQARWPQVGFHEVDPDWDGTARSKKYKPIKDADNNPVTKPWPLYFTGVAMPAGEEMLWGSSIIYQEVPFGPLNLG